MTIKDFAELYGGIDYIESIIFVNDEEKPRYRGNIRIVPEELRDVEISTWYLGEVDLGEMTIIFYCNTEG